jgi:hypothetical protein
MYRIPTRTKVKTTPIAKPPNYWKDLENQRTFFDGLASQLRITHPDDWSKYTAEDIIQQGGSFIRRYYNGSLSKGKLEIQ